MKTHPSTDAIWTEQSADLRRFIRRRVSDDHTADDLLQETFIRIHRNLGTLQDADRLAGWVYRIARNVIHDHRRRSAKESVALNDDPVDAQRDDDAMNQACWRGAGWLDEMIRSVPSLYQQALQLAEIGGMTQQELATQLGITLSGAKSRVQRGRKLLRQLLDQHCTFHFDHAGRPIDCAPRKNQDLCQGCGDT